MHQFRIPIPQKVSYTYHHPDRTVQRTVSYCLNERDHFEIITVHEETTTPKERGKHWLQSTRANHRKKCDKPLTLESDSLQPFGLSIIAFRQTKS